MRKKEAVLMNIHGFHPRRKMRILSVRPYPAYIHSSCSTNPRLSPFDRTDVSTISALIAMTDF